VDVSLAVFPVDHGFQPAQCHQRFRDLRMGCPDNCIRFFVVEPLRTALFLIYQNKILIPSVENFNIRTKEKDILEFKSIKK
jgi:hypothetical protein